MDSEAINPVRKADSQAPPPPRPSSGTQANPAPPPAPSSPVTSTDTVSLSSQAQILAQNSNGGVSKNPSHNSAVSAPANNASRQQRKFSITDNNDVVLKIVNNKTQEVVKQIPTEEELRLRNAIRNVISDITEDHSSG